MPSSCELGGLESDPVAHAPSSAVAPIEVTTPNAGASSGLRPEVNAGASQDPERGGLRRPGPRARVECAIKVNAAQNACRAGQLGPARAVRHLVPSSCELGGLESDPVARDPTRPHQPAPQQRQLPTPERHPSPQQQNTKRNHKRKGKKKNAGAAAAIPERGGLRRTGPRARVEAPLRSTPTSLADRDRGGSKAVRPRSSPGAAVAASPAARPGGAAPLARASPPAT